MRKIINCVKSIWLAVIYCFFPKLCISCGKTVEENEYLCKECKKQLEVINPKKRCKRCGLEKSECLCKMKVFRFDSLVSLYKNSGVAKTAYYKYKLSGKIGYADYFADELAKAFNNEYKDIKFRGLINVPSPRFSIIRRGYDHTAVICEKLSEKIGIRYIKNVITCKPFSKSQHKSGYKQRLLNVRGKYRFKRKLRSGNYLLFDDIVTTGSTADAVSREILRAGADKVYVLSILQTVPKKKIEKTRH